MKRSGLRRRRSPISSTGKEKPRTERRTTDEAYEDAWRRDRGCVAPLLDPDAGPCRDHFGRIIARDDRRGLTFDHVNMDATRWPRWLRPVVVICAGHHLLTDAGANWATSRRELLRDHLRRWAATSTQE